METQIGQTAFVIDNSKKHEIRDSEQSFSLLLPIKPDTLNKQCTPPSGAVIKDKDQRNKSFVSDRREKGSCRETDIMPMGYNYIVDIKLEEEVLIKGRISKKGVQSVRKRERDAALQNTLQSEGRKRRCRSSSLKVGSQKDIVTEKKCTSSLLEPKQKIQSFAKNAKNLKKNCQHSLIMRGLHKEMKTLTEKDGTSVIIGLGSDKVSGILQKSDSCSASESRPLQKMWNFRERIKSVWPEQKQDKSQRVKRSVPKLESTIQNLSLLKYRERKRVITSPKLQVDVKYPVRARLTAVPHLPSKCTEGTESLMKNARVSLVKPREQKRKKENFFMELTDSKLEKGVKASDKNSQHLLESVANFEENKKCRSTVIEGINRMVTRALSKSKIYRSDGEKQSWKSEKGTEILGCRQWILEEKMTREQMDCVPTEKLLVTKTEGTSKEESDGKDEIVTSTDLKKGIKTSREDTLDILSIQNGKLPDTILNTSKDSSIETPLEQSVCLPITESDEIKSNNSISPYFWRETKIYCDAFFSVTNTKCPERFDIKLAEKKIGKNALVEYQGERLGWLNMQSVPPCSIKKTPVVKLFDCCYIKALLEPTGVKPTQSYKVHCGSLHVALDRGKSLSSRGMGQNDLSSSSNVIHAVKLVPQKDILVSKEMCQYSKKCQNGRRFRENNLSMDFKKPSKRLKMPEDLEESAVMKVLINRDISSEHGIPREDNTVAVDSSVILEKLNYSEPNALSLLDCIPDLSLEQPPQNQVDNLSNNETANQEHFITYSSSIFEKSVVLKKEKNELKQIETFNDFSKMDENKSIVEAQDSEKSMICNSNAAACMKRKRTCEIKVNKAGSKQQLYSCQRAVPINGKNIWPRESCARTSLWVHKNHVLDSERGSLRGTDSVTKCREFEVHKPLSDSKISAHTIVHHKIECTVGSPLSDCTLHVGKTRSAITGTENRFSDTERSKQSTPDTKIVKSKVILNSLGKEVKGKKNVNIQNGTFADTRKKKTDNPKTSVTKQEPVLKTLMTGTLSNFKIPLLKDKSDFRKLETARSSEKGTCNPSNNLENSLSEKKARIKETSSEENPSPQFQSEQMNCIPLQKYTNQFNDIPENTSKKRSICNMFERTSHESKLELPTLKATSFFLSTGNTEKQMLNSTLASETIDKVNFNNKLAQDDNICADILKAYEDDVLLIDVIEDDPDLFGDTDEQEGVYTKVHNTKNIYTCGFPEENLELKSESSQLPKSSHLKCIRDNLIQDYGTLKSEVNTDGLLIQVDEIKSETLSGISSIGGISESSLEDGQLTEPDELRKVFDTVEKYEFSETLLAMQEQKTSVQDFAKIENTIEPLKCDQQLELPFPTVKAIVPQRQDTALKSWISDFRFPKKCPPLLSSTTNSYETWKVEKNSVTDLGLTFLPRGYCRYHFNSLNGCKRPNCRYWHVLVSGNEKLCSEIIKKYISIGEVVLLQRAVHIFTDYYKEGTTVDHLDSQMFHDLLTSLLQSSLLKELFHVVHTGIMIKILPTVDILLKMFEEVASMKVREVVPELSDIFCKLIDAGMVLECEHIGYITKLLNQLHVSNREITMLMSRFQGRHFHKASFCDFDSAVAEFQHCKEISDWAKLGTLYVNAKRECKNVDNLEKYSLYVASILISSVKEEKPGIPFCEFAAAVNVDAHRDEGDMSSLGRIGISVMFSYYKIHQWSKAKKVLDVLHALKIHFTFLKGLLGQEGLVSRCHIVNVAVEIFLKCGSLDGALWILRESEWIINTASWPCDRMDVLIRHNLLYAIASKLMIKNRYGETFEVLQNLPGFQNTCDTLDVSQYSLLFNKLLNACSESRNIGMSSIVVEFMLARNIPVEFNLLRALITALGRSCLWLKARTHYKSALALGCYPPPEGNLYRKLLLIPYYMTEVEMLLAIEIFLVSNASSIQSPGASNQILQIVLKRCEGNNTRNNEEYQNAVERLIQAARISNPKLFVKHLTVNVNMEQVYSLEHTCVLKWLKENMKWAGKVWLF